MSLRRPGLPQVLLLVAAVGSTGCSMLVANLRQDSIDGRIGERVEKPVPALPAFEAGAARVDLTPIPGIPLGGYSVEGKISRGFWGRLWARAIYLEDEDEFPLVLVSTNLMIMPYGLSNRVTELVQEHLPHVGRENVVLAATETHQSPGNFFSDPMHNAVGSAESGFDEALFDFLAIRITKAIVDAHEARRPARVRLGNPASLQGLVRNRSLEAFMVNPGAANLMQGRPTCPADQYFDSPDECRAVEPRIDVLELVERDDPTQRIALAVFLATHTTILDKETEVFAGDFFEATATLLETDAMQGVGPCPAQEDAFPVVALFNGAQGDVSPNYHRSPRDRARVLQLGRDVAERVCTTLGAPDLTNTEIRFRYQFQSLDHDRFLDEAFPTDALIPYVLTDPDCHYNFELAQPPPSRPWRRRTARDPKPGFPQMGGAEDGYSFFHEIGLLEGDRASKRQRNEAGHGIKKSRLDLGWLSIPIGRVALDFLSPAEEAPVGVYRIGDHALVGLPGEFTTSLGGRVRHLVSLEAGLPPGGRVILIGMANGHTSYVTTPEEYDAQHYEGASSLYGPGIGHIFAQRLACLAKKTLEIPRQREFALTYDHDVGEPRRFSVPNVGGPPYFVDDGLAAIAMDPATGHVRRDYPTFCWIDDVPGLGMGGPACARTLPRVVVKDGDVPVASNEELGIVTVVTDVGLDAAKKLQAEWCAIWLADDADPAKTYTFHVEPVGAGRTVPPHPMSPTGLSQRALARPLSQPPEGGLLCDWFGHGCPATCSAPTPALP